MRDAAEAEHPGVAGRGCGGVEDLAGPRVEPVDADQHAGLRARAVLEPRDHAGRGRLGVDQPLLGAPTPELRKRVQDASSAAQRTNEISRYGTYLYFVNQMYLGAKAALETPVEDQSLQTAQGTVEQLTCVKDYADAADLLAKAVANVTAVEAYQAKEAACMASAPCKAKRIAAQICSAIRPPRDREGHPHRVALRRRDRLGQRQAAGRRQDRPRDDRRRGRRGPAGLSRADQAGVLGRQLSLTASIPRAG